MFNPYPLKLGQRPVYSGVNARIKDHRESLSLLERAGSFISRGLKVLPGCQYGVGNVAASFCADIGLLSDRTAREAPVELLDDKTRGAMQGWFCPQTRIKRCMRSTLPVSPAFVQELFKTAQDNGCERWLFNCVTAVSDDVSRLMEFVESILLTEDERKTLNDIVRKRADGSFREEQYRDFLDRRDPINNNYTILQKVICATRCLAHIDAILKAGVELPAADEDQNSPETMALAAKDEHIALKLLAQRQYQDAKAKTQDGSEVPCVLATYQFDERNEGRIEAERKVYQGIKAHRSGNSVNAVLMVCRARDGRVISWLVHASCYPHNPHIIPISHDHCLIDPAAAARSHWEEAQKPEQSSLWEQLPGRVVRSVSYGAGAFAICWFSGAMLLLPAVIAAGSFLEGSSKEARVSRSAAGLAGMALGSCIGQPAGGYTLGATIGQAAHYCSNSMARAVGEELRGSDEAIYVLTCIGGTYWLVNRSYLGLAGRIGCGALTLGMLKKNPGRTFIYGGLSFAAWYVLAANQVEMAILDTPEKIAGLMAAAGTLMAHNMELGRVMKTLGGIKNLAVRACSDVVARDSNIVAGKKRSHPAGHTDAKAEKQPRLPQDVVEEEHSPESELPPCQDIERRQQQEPGAGTQLEEQTMEVNKPTPVSPVLSSFLSKESRSDPEVGLTSQQLDQEREYILQRGFWAAKESSPRKPCSRAIASK